MVGILAAVGSGTIVPFMSVRLVSSQVSLVLFPSLFLHRFGSVLQLLVDHELCSNHNITMTEATIKGEDLPKVGSSSERVQNPDVFIIILFFL